MSKNSRKKNAPAKKRKGPSRPAKPPVPQQPAAPIRTKVTIEDGVVKMKYSESVTWIGMTAHDALYLASILRMRAETLILAAEESSR